MVHNARVHTVQSTIHLLLEASGGEGHVGLDAREEERTVVLRVDGQLGHVVRRRAHSDRVGAPLESLAVLSSHLELHYERAPTNAYSQIYGISQPVPILGYCISTLHYIHLYKLHDTIGMYTTMRWVKL